MLYFLSPCLSTGSTWVRRPISLDRSHGGSSCCSSTPATLASHSHGISVHPNCACSILITLQDDGRQERMRRPGGGREWLRFPIRTAAVARCSRWVVTVQSPLALTSSLPPIPPPTGRGAGAGAGSSRSHTTCPNVSDRMAGWHSGRGGCGCG